MNNIELSKIYLPLLDELYKQECKTAILEGDETTIKKQGNGEVKIAKLDMDGLGDFSRNTGYTHGNTTLAWETVKYDKERSQDLRIDRLDNDESLQVPFAKLMSEFIRTKVVPETDAARIAKIASTTGVTAIEGAVAGDTILEALIDAMSKLDENEVPAENRILLITPTLYRAVEKKSLEYSRNILTEFSNISIVPSNRMKTKIVLNDGTSTYGYKADVDAQNINFMILERSAVTCAMEQYVKYFSPDQDQNGDSHVFKYRNYNLYGHVYENKKAGVYVSVAPKA